MSEASKVFMLIETELLNEVKWVLLHVTPLESRLTVLTPFSLHLARDLFQNLFVLGKSKR